MKTTIIIIGIIVLYVIPCIIRWKWTHKVYNIHGRWKLLNASIVDIFFTFFPLVNILPAIMNLFDSPKERFPDHHDFIYAEKDKSFFNWVFQVKSPGN